MSAALVMLAGPPGVGKSTLAEAVTRRSGATWLSVDAAEDGMLVAGLPHDEHTGLAAYVAVERLAEQNLAVGRTVIVDAVNDHPLARTQWSDLAARAGVPLLAVELVLPADVQAERLAGRRRGFTHLPEPGREASLARAAAFGEWDGERLRLDATSRTELLVEAVLDALPTAVRGPS